jgi:hypothetical protein
MDDEQEMDTLNDDDETLDVSFMDEENALQKDSKSHFVKDANLFCRKHQLRLTLKGLYLCNINEQE